MQDVTNGRGVVVEVVVLDDVVLSTALQTLCGPQHRTADIVCGAAFAVLQALTADIA
jgi:hypothetical protein